MRGYIRPLLFLLHVVCLAIFVVSSATSPALAQCTTLDGMGRTVTFLPAVAKPEGNAPQYLNGGTVTFSYVGGDENLNNTSIFVPLDYHWVVSGSDIHFRVNVGTTRTFDPASHQLTATFNVGDDSLRAMGTGGTVDLPGGDPSGSTCALYHSDNMPYYELGLTTVTVKNASGADVPGATIQMFCTAATAASVHIAAKPGQTLFGQGVYVPGDSPYPAGLLRFDYQLSATAPGYQGAYSSASAGATWPGQTVAFVLAPVGSSSTSTATTTATTGNPDTNPTTSSGFPSDFFGQLQTMLTNFFTLQQADIDAINGVKSEFLSYGPFSIPAQVQREFNNAFPPPPGPTSYDPNYWQIPLHFGEDTIPITIAPSGYTQASAPPGLTRVNNIFTAMWPSYFDVTPYSDFILRGRKIALILFWGLILVGLIRRFTPELRI